LTEPSRSLHITSGKLPSYQGMERRRLRTIAQALEGALLERGLVALLLPVLLAFAFVLAR